jgi:hypothetical protein
MYPRKLENNSVDTKIGQNHEKSWTAANWKRVERDGVAYPPDSCGKAVPRIGRRYRRETDRNVGKAATPNRCGNADFQGQKFKKSIVRTEQASVFALV